MNGANFTAEELIQAINDSLNQPKRPLRIEYNQGDILNAIEAGKLLANQRIIKLLEKHLGAYENTPDVTPDFGIEVAIGLVKALIKGERQKDNETVVVLTEGEK